MHELDSSGWLAAFVAGLLLEITLGEPHRWHPLAGFGWLADHLRQKLNRNAYRFWRGLAAWLVLLGIGLGCFAVLEQGLGIWGHALALWFALGARSLREHVLAIIGPLERADLPGARLAVSRIVSRDCSALDETGVSRAALESTLENGADAIFATLFWFALLGGWGAVLHRLANTLDAMWGYRTQELALFGKPAARLDDALNYLPARLTALTYALLGATKTALLCWREQAPRWDSPNAGPVMASGAGALGVQLGGAARYHGHDEVRPPLGAGPQPGASDVRRGLRLVTLTLGAWLTVLFLTGIWRWTA